MILNTAYLKEFISLDLDTDGIKQLLESMGIEVEEIGNFDGTDTIEVEITPNRPDWLSHKGIARDMHAKNPTYQLKENALISDLDAVSSEDFSIHIENGDDCPRYSGAIIRDISVQESSERIQSLLKSMGLRPINAIVDISNIILMTTGQPIHIFDLDKLKGDRIQIRRAKQGESLTLLDENKVKLDEQMLIIADESEPIALAGIMGGLDSGVTFETRNIFIESAKFDAVVVRKTAKKLGLTTDASFRFERGTDIAITRDVIAETIDMIRDEIKSDLAIDFCKDAYPNSHRPQFVSLPKSYPQSYSGIDISESESERILNRLGFKTESTGDTWEVTVPSFRVDIYGKQDLIEEIVRIYGYDNLKSVLPEVSTTKLKKWPFRDLKRQIDQYLVNNGAYETLNYSFHRKEDNRFFGDGERDLQLKNPLGLDYSIMRNSLIPGILKNIATNFNQSSQSAFFFETGSVFSLNPDLKPDFNHDLSAISQRKMLAVGASGIFRKSNWRIKESIEWDLYLFKSVLVNLFKSLFIDIDLVSTTVQYLSKDSAFEIQSNGISLGFIGQLEPSTTAVYRVEKPVFIAEIDLENCLSIQKEFKLQMWPKFPSTKRDFSFFMDNSGTYASIRETIDQIKPNRLVSYELFDRYEGKGNPEGKISLSMSFTYQDPARTLENNEVNEIHEKFITELIEKRHLVQR